MKKLLTVMLLAAVLVTNALATFCMHNCGPDVTCPDGSYYAGSDSEAYANSVVTTSGTVTNPNRAVGTDDNQYAEIYATHPDSYLVLDMGAGEEVWDRMNLDVRLYGDNSDEDAKVYVSNDLSTWFLAGTVNSDEDADIELPNNAVKYRYVKVVNPNQQSRVEVDAVRGFCISNPEEENQVPEFGTLGALGVLAVAGLFIAKRRL
ncbi:MAG: DUF3999 domain-containing protein [Nanoarchaeota archaeon]|nr:DUF3999 domain-containing protein [Nanoarchaeota archaeon]